MPLNPTGWKIGNFFTQIIYRPARLILLCLAPWVLSACSVSRELAIPTPIASQIAMSTRLSPTQTIVMASRTSPPPTSPAPSATIVTTPTPQPTYILPVPSPVSGQIYQLATWTTEKAEQLILDLKNYPETLENNGQAVIYYPAFQYEGVIELESALRFPHSDQENLWRWNGAYNLYRSDNTDRAGLYAGLIANALNRKETDLQTIENWFVKTIAFSLETYPISPPQGYQNSLVLHIYNPEYTSFSGGFAIWLVQKDEIFYGYPLENEGNNPYGTGVSQVDTIDITGDGIAEAIVQNSDWQSFGFHSGDLKIYRLDQVPPREIIFDPPLDNPDLAVWSVTNLGQPVPTVTFRIPVSIFSDAPCYPFQVDWQYQLQGARLRFIGIKAPPIEAMQEKPYCTRVLASILQSSAFLKNKAALGLYLHLLDLEFIEKDLSFFEQPYSVEKERLSLALYLSDQGDETGANEQIRQIRAGSDASLAEWRKDAIAYYAIHRDPQALFQFCLSSSNCEFFLNFPEIVALIPPNRFSEVGMVLQEMGIQFNTSGNFDFDQDGQNEKWLLFLSSSPCGTGTEFWILAKGDNTIESRRAGWPCLREESDEERALAIKPLALSGGLPSYQLTVSDEERPMEPFLYWPMDGKNPIIDFWQAKQKIDAIQNKLLLSQISPDEAQAQLVAIQESPLELEISVDHLRAQMLYLVGLTQELSGKNTLAVETYLELWKTYPNDPFAWMAYTKLEPKQ